MEYRRAIRLSVDTLLQPWYTVIAADKTADMCRLCAGALCCHCLCVQTTPSFPCVSLTASPEKGRKEVNVRCPKGPDPVHWRTRTASTSPNRGKAAPASARQPSSNSASPACGNVRCPQTKLSSSPCLGRKSKQPHLPSHGRGCWPSTAVASGRSGLLLCQNHRLSLHLRLLPALLQMKQSHPVRESRVHPGIPRGKEITSHG